MGFKKWRGFRATLNWKTKTPSKPQAVQCIGYTFFPEEPVYQIPEGFPGNREFISESNGYNQIPSTNNHHEPVTNAKKVVKSRAPIPKAPVQSLFLNSKTVNETEQQTQYEQLDKSSSNQKKGILKYKSTSNLVHDEDLNDSEKNYVMRSASTSDLEENSILETEYNITSDIKQHTKNVDQFNSIGKINTNLNEECIKVTNLAVSENEIINSDQQNKSNNHSNILKDEDIAKDEDVDYTFLNNSNFSIKITGTLPSHSYKEEKLTISSHEKSFQSGNSSDSKFDQYTTESKHESEPPSYGFNSYSSQAASIFFDGEDATPVQRNRNFTLANDDNLSNGSEASA